MSEITRETGIPVIAPNGVFCGMAGGGVSGSTKELDSVVSKAAAALGEAFDRPVSIRFNSDRKSGGAWLKHNTGHWLTSDSQVTIGASLVTMADVQRWQKMDEEDVDMMGESWRARLPKREAGIFVKVGVAAAVLKDGADMSEWREAKGLDNEPKFWGKAGHVQEALEMLVAVVDPAKLP